MVFDRFTEQARRALFFARFETSRLGGEAVEAEHLLLGVVRAAGGPTRDLLKRGRVSLKELRKQVRARMAGRERVPTSAEVPFSEETRRILTTAEIEADHLGHTGIGTGHLLLGILRHSDTEAARLALAEALNVDAVREAVTSSGGD